MYEAMKICQMSSVHPDNDVRIIKQAETLADEFDAELVFVVPTKKKIEESSEKVKIEPVLLPRNRLERMFSTSLKVGFKAFKTKADIIEFHDSELIPVGLLLKVLGFKVVYDVHESLADDILTKEYLPSWSRKILSFSIGNFQKNAARLFDGVLTATPNIADEFNSKKIYSLRNFPRLDSMPRPIAFSERKNQIFYGGNISKRRGAIEMVESISHWPPGFELVLAGNFESQELLDRCTASPNWERVRYLGHIDRSTLFQHLSESKIGLVLFHPGPNHDQSMPNKLFEYMAAQVPILGSNFPAWQPILQGINCGKSVNPQSAQEIGLEISTMLQDPNNLAEMGENGRKAILDEFNWETESKKLIELYTQLR
jgi:glycosyltransferase involved in cell wall biosynthesis